MIWSLEAIPLFQIHLNSPSLSSVRIHYKLSSPMYAYIVYAYENNKNHILHWTKYYFIQPLLANEKKWKKDEKLLPLEHQPNFKACVEW